MILLPNGAIELLPAAYYDKQAHVDMMLWCHHHARYGLPTVELIEWLKERIGDRTAIEIGAGSGDLCHHLGVKGIDNYQQTFPDVEVYYRLAGQPTIKYAPWVENIGALEAVTQYRPQVVIGSWITEWISPLEPPPPHGGNMFGVKESEMLPLVETYILIGNKRIHGNKEIMKLPHTELQLPFVKSRSSRPDQDRVYIWGK